MWIADPKAIFQILHSCDSWVKTAADREINALLLDRGLVWAQGDAHRRQRKALTPAFGLNEVKALVPRFLMVANRVRDEATGVFCHDVSFFGIQSPNFNLPISSRIQLVDKWRDLVANEASGGSHILDMPAWMGKSTLDA